MDSALVDKHLHLDKIWTSGMDGQCLYCIIVSKNNQKMSVDRLATSKTLSQYCSFLIPHILTWGLEKYILYMDTIKRPRLSKMWVCKGKHLYFSKPFEPTNACQSSDRQPAIKYLLNSAYCRRWKFSQPWSCFWTERNQHLPRSLNVTN